MLRNIMLICLAGLLSGCMGSMVQKAQEDFKKDLKMAQDQAAKQYAEIAPEVAKKRAAFDLNCGEKNMSVSNVGQGLWGIRGCGKSAVYAVNCPTSSVPTSRGQFDPKSIKVEKDGCTAILNSPIGSNK